MHLLILLAIFANPSCCFWHWAPVTAQVTQYNIKMCTNSQNFCLLLTIKILLDVEYCFVKNETWGYFTAMHHINLLLTYCYYYYRQTIWTQLQQSTVQLTRSWLDPHTEYLSPAQQHPLELQRSFMQNLTNLRKALTECKPPPSCHLQFCQKAYFVAVGLANFAQIS